MTLSDRRTEPVYEIDLRDLATEDPGGTTVVLPDLQDEPERPGPGARDPADLVHPETAVRLAALSGLARHAEAIPVEDVTERLRDPEPAVRRAAVEVIEASGDERMLLLLLDAIDDPLDEIRDAVHNALRRHRSPGLVALLRQELSVPIRARVADAALAVLGRSHGEGRGTTEPRGVSDHPGSEGLSELIDQLADRRPEHRRIACERLGFMRARSALEALVERLADPERGVRIKAADALGLIGDERALEGLERARASDPDPGVAMALERAIAALSARR